jgi:hypothetical protein
VGADALEQGGHDQEGVGEHGRGHPAVPAAPAADLVLLQASKALAGRDGLLDAPALAGDLGQAGQRDRAGWSSGSRPARRWRGGDRP